MLIDNHVFLHIILAVRGEDCFIKSSFRGELEGYICGIALGMDSEVCAVYCHYDHLHIFFRISPDISIDEFVSVIKRGSVRIAENAGWVEKGNFSWYKNYAVFSYSPCEVEAVVKYIKAQREYHKTVSFREEFIEFLKIFNIDYDEDNLFDEDDSTEDEA